MNLSSVVGSGKVREGSFDNKTVVRTATISSRYQVLIVTLRPLENIPGSAEFVVVYEKVSAYFCVRDDDYSICKG